MHFQRKLSTVEQEVSQVEKDTSHSLSYLVKLDTVKNKLKATSKALQEADNWTTLMADIEEVGSRFVDGPSYRAFINYEFIHVCQLFESNDLVALSNRLNSLRQSLDLLSHVSDYGERMMQLDGLRNRLEAMASPHLVAAISAGDADKTLLMVQVFTNMDRLEQLLHYYTKCRRGSLLQQWKELSNGDPEDLLDVIQRFYEHILTDLQEQTRWYLSVFRRPPSGTSRTLLPIYTQALSALDPSPLHELESVLIRKSAGEGLSVLQQLKTAADRLAHGVEAHFRDAAASGGGSGAGPLVEEEVLLHFGESLYQIFRLLVSNKYKNLCLQHLTEQFAQPPTHSGDAGESDGDISEVIHVLRENHSKISSLMEASLNDCSSLTQGCALPMLIEVRPVINSSSIPFIDGLFFFRPGTLFLPSI